MRVPQWAIGVIVITAAALPAQAASTTVFKCVDGDPNSLEIAGNRLPGVGAIACDGDGMRDGACTFLSGCPPCVLSVPQCAAPCFIDPHYPLVAVRTGRSHAIGIGQQTLIFRCNAAAVRHHR